MKSICKKISNGDKYYYNINDKLRREDGPACEDKDNTIYWYLNDEYIKPINEMMEKYIRLNPDNILKNYKYPLKIQILAISLNFDIKCPHSKLKKIYPQLFVLKDSGLI